MPASAPAQPKGHTASTPAAPAPAPSPESVKSGDSIASDSAEPKPVAPATESDDFAFVMLPDELAKTTAPQHARSEKQLRMDKRVKALHDTWTRAGKPTGSWQSLVTKRVVATLFVSPEEAADTKRLIGRAATFHGRRAKFGKSFTVTKALAEKYGRPESDIGKEAISVAIMDKLTKGAKVTVTAAK